MWQVTNSSRCLPVFSPTHRLTLISTLSLFPCKKIFKWNPFSIFTSSVLCSSDTSCYLYGTESSLFPNVLRKFHSDIFPPITDILSNKSPPVYTSFYKNIRTSDTCRSKSKHQVHLKNGICFFSDEKNSKHSKCQIEGKTVSAPDPKDVPEEDLRQVGIFWES